MLKALYLQRGPAKCAPYLRFVCVPCIAFRGLRKASFLGLTVD